MIQKDYLERMTQQIAQIIARLIGLNIDESLEIIDQAYQEWIHLDRSFLNSIPVDDILAVLLEEKNLNINQLEFIAELLAKEGQIHFDDKQLQKSRDTLQKSLILFRHVDQAQQLYSFDRQSKLKNIQKLLKEIDEQKEL